ncbi:MAG: hypothetical protein ACI8RZ_007122 [Myxococcota bacterium]
MWIFQQLCVCKDTVVGCHTTVLSNAREDRCPFLITDTDLFLAIAGGGSAEPRGSNGSRYTVVRTPDNPGYFHGNFLLLAEPRGLWTTPVSR